MAKRIHVDIPDQPSYDILIERGLLEAMDERAAEFDLDGTVVVGTNTLVDELYGDDLVWRLPQAWRICMDDGEQYKNLDTVRMLYDQMLQHGADRHTTVVALGGGVVGDTVGFVAATYMRGLPLVQMPTTLLAMVDSSVGGKVGVDLPQGKNLVGAFKQPERVLIDPDVLQTLSDDEWRCGMAETIKHGILADETLLDSDLWQPERVEELIARAVQVKVDVVGQDPFEHGIRAHLNLGHTFGHAIEKVTNFEWLHGDGVGFGLLAAATLSHRLGMVGEDVVQRIDGLLAELGLPRTLGGLSPDAVYDAMTTDKKWKNGQSRFILLEGMQQATVVKGVERAVVVDVLETLRA